MFKVVNISFNETSSTNPFLEKLRRTKGVPNAKLSPKSSVTTYLITLFSVVTIAAHCESASSGD